MRLIRRVSGRLIVVLAILAGPSPLHAQDLCQGNGLDDDSYVEARSLLCDSTWKEIQKQMVTASLLNGGTGALEDAPQAELARTLLRYINRLEVGTPVAAEELLAAIASDDAGLMRQGIRFSAVKLAFNENELKLWCQRSLLPEASVSPKVQGVLDAIEFAVRCGD